MKVEKFLLKCSFLKNGNKRTRLCWLVGYGIKANCLTRDLGWLVGWLFMAQDPERTY